MGKSPCLVLILWTSLLVAACTLQAAPLRPVVTATGLTKISATPAATLADALPGESGAPSTPSLPPETLSASPSGPPALRGQFRLTNTSTPGMEVGVESMDILLEARQPGAVEWNRVETDCSFTPAASVVLKDQLDIQYDCQLAKPLPEDVELRAIAEVTVFGSDEVFRIEIEVP